jgi:hypothetical protein
VLPDTPSDPDMETLDEGEADFVVESAAAVTGV